MGKKKAFISFRYSDGKEVKDELQEILKEYIIDKSEDEDRSNMSDSTIQSYLYNKLKDTSLTIVVLTPEAINYRKDSYGKYDDWLYDELRYSLADREKNRTNGVIAIYTKEAEKHIMQKNTHYCDTCKEESNINTIKNFNNLVRENIHNIMNEYKTNPCEGVYNGLEDSYISLVSLKDFKEKPEHYIENAMEKRERKQEFNIRKVM